MNHRTVLQGKAQYRTIIVPCGSVLGVRHRTVPQGRSLYRTVIVPCGSVLGGAAQNGYVEQYAQNENRAVRWCFGGSITEQFCCAGTFWL